MFKKYKALKLQKSIETAANNLLLSPNLNFKSKIEIMSGAQDLFKRELEKL